MSPVLCITGMHRSGTSLVTAWLRHCGLVISDGKLLGPWKGNPKGHFEDLEIYRQQLAALRARRPHARGWRAYDTTPLTFPPAQATQIRELVAVRQAKYPVWGWKDPRSTLFLDQWEEILPGLTYLFLWRPAAAVVDSLYRRGDRREKLPLLFFQGVRGWLAYNRRLLAHRQTYPQRTLLCSLDQVLAHDQSVLDELNERFGLGLSYRPVTDLYEPPLLRQRPGILARISGWYPGVRAVTRRLLEA